MPIACADAVGSTLDMPLSDMIHVAPNGRRYQRVAIMTTTPSDDTQVEPVSVGFKTFWKTTHQWTPAEIAAYHEAVPELARQIRQEAYWDKHGRVRTTRLTCEDFTVRVLIQFAASRGLPMKLETGVRAYRNMEILGRPKHERYDSTRYGFAEMVELTFGAPDMQRAASNTVRVPGPDALLPGDILALAHDWKGRHTGGAAHHIQLVTRASDSLIEIAQGNSNSSIHAPITWINRLLGRNAADPQQSAYAGLPIETGRFIKERGAWNYRNDAAGNSKPDYLGGFDLLRWNFMAFNR